MTIECSAFTATPIAEGRIKLEIQSAAPPRKEVYTAGEAVARLSEIFGKPLHRNSLAYWRKQGLPCVKLGEKKIMYSEDDLVRWAQGRITSAIPAPRMPRGIIFEAPR
jgi:hypothetical protein